MTRLPFALRRRPAENTKHDTAIAANLSDLGYGD